MVVTLGGLLKVMGQTLLLSFLLHVTWNGNVMAGAPALILGLEVTCTIGAVCWNGGAVVLKF